MDHIESKRRSLFWRSFAALLVPFVVSSIYLFFSRWPLARFTAFSDYVGLAVAVLAGAAFVATLPIRWQIRAVLLFFYIPAISVIQFVYLFQFIGVVFGHWL